MTKQELDEDMQDFVRELFSEGKTPSEKFGLTSEQLSQLEKDLEENTGTIHGQESIG